ncbi:hypothetical protein BA190_30650 [Labrys sp. WJW]|nr:hypothetical protein BA190_30650 [Labrys sp. WJW]
MKGLYGSLLVGALFLFSAVPPSAAQSFGGNECTDDCSGHQAGYRWAEEHGINNSSDCGGNSESFREGCVTYTEDSSRGADQDDDGQDIEE